METIKAIFTESVKRTPTIKSFRFAPEKPFPFLPGQFVRVVFDETRQSNAALNKYLSMSASPLRPYLEVTKRLSESDFSRRLDALNPGDRVMINGPMGNCVFRKEYSRICFLVGGIGITPVLSILEYVAENNFPVELTLFYASRNDEEIAFRNELEDIRRNYPSLRIFYTVSDCEPAIPDCERGYITSQMIAKNLADPGSNVFFVFGPPRMVAAMKSVCDRIGCPAGKIHMENFAGYE